ncbi:MAG: PhnD/SsuA/transferrin family substrate-binding protein [Deltaproteobacteria bacterium]|nr:PhnD/SsuA/transferrin family substrate-binding protein [Deltaproteobacteria bacterium]
MRLGVPPSPSVEVARARTAPLAAALAARGVTVELVFADSYDALGDLVLTGKVDAAWAPPIVCARVEAAGGVAALRAVRGGSTSYRVALVCRAGPVVELARHAELTAAWVDENSAAGYLLARSWLAGRHIDAVKGFKRALFLGSYTAALTAVADGRADLTSMFASTAAAPARTALDEVDAALRARVQVFGYTAETETDGVVLPPNAPPTTRDRLLQGVAALTADAAGVGALRELLGCEELRAVPPRPTSPALQALIMTSPR